MLIDVIIEDKLPKKRISVIVVMPMKGTVSGMIHKRDVIISTFFRLVQLYLKMILCVGRLNALGILRKVDQFLLKSQR